MSGHLQREHKTPLELRKQVDRYIERFPFEYNYSTVRLPADGLVSPQPIVRVIDGFKCQHCDRKSRNRNAMREHGNKVHGKKRVADEDLFIPVRLQSWFGKKRERYWVVDESQQPEPGQDPAQELESRVGSAGAGPSDPPDQDKPGSSDDSDSQEDVDDQILQDIQRSQAYLQEQRLVLLKKVPVVELDSWLRFTGWNEVLSQSEHNMKKTHEFTREPDPEEPELTRLFGNMDPDFGAVFGHVSRHGSQGHIKVVGIPQE
jgi:hypothetical protein